MKVLKYRARSLWVVKQTLYRFKLFKDYYTVVESKVEPNSETPVLGYATGNPNTLPLLIQLYIIRP